jgi:UDP-GlcNAc:undecaprenyl-phosphate/decaprenyl-phosphate GlcNAc-1-phosphate transferase
VVGVSVLGLLDDLAGTAPAGGARERHDPLPRGWRGHARAAAGGRLSTGALKAVGTLGLAAFVLLHHGLDNGDYLLAVAVLVLATNVFNLLDLRPGRSIKALVLLGAGLTIGSTDLDQLWTLAVFVGPILVLLPFDLRERGMLGDAGSNAVGGVAGLWLVFTLSTAGQAIALALLLVITIYGEFRSISELVERTPGLRQLDSLGRMRLSPHA